MKETQMTATEKPEAGAPSTSTSWESINWKSVKAHVSRLQMRIAKAVREGHHHKAKALQWLLTHSYNAKLLAVRRVTQNHGKDTPGVDGVVWKTSRQKMQAVSEVKRRGYQPQPLRRIYIPKKDGRSKRPLSIPAMNDRGQQAIHLMALEPAVEIIADRHSYGFRPDRSCADAIERCFNASSKQGLCPMGTRRGYKILFRHNIKIMVIGKYYDGQDDVEEVARSWLCRRGNLLSDGRRGATREPYLTMPFS